MHFGGEPDLFDDRTEPDPRARQQHVRPGYGPGAPSPWGNSYAANLTPDPETGLGARYTEAAFIKTMRTGKKPEGEVLLPPMPWPAFRNMSDEDLKAVYAYLTSLKPAKNFVRATPTLVAGTR
jgi:cytochrome c553